MPRRRRYARKKKKKRAARQRRTRRPRETHRQPPPAARPRPDPGKGTEASLRDRIIEFIHHPRFGKDYERALRLYFGKDFRGRTLVAEEEKMPGFQEWFVHDFVKRDKRRLIDQFAEVVGSDLPQAEAELLAAWREMNRLRLFEAQAVHPDRDVVVRDLLSGETLTINDYSASRTMRRWMVFLARPHQAEDRVCFTGSSPALTPRYKGEMLDAARQLWEDYQARQPDATLSDFYRDHSLDLIRTMEHLQEEARRPPTVLTAEGHELVIARARYTVHDPNAVADILTESEEFSFAGFSEELPDAMHFNWLLRGRSHVPEKPMPDKDVVTLSADVTTGPGRPTFRSLGDMTLGEKRLELECLSRERLKAGKALLTEMLGGLVKHRRDRFKSFEMEALADDSGPAPQRRAPRRRLSPIELALQQDLRERHTDEWLDSPVPGLNNLSPRQAMSTPEGRAEVIEMLKYAEYLDDNRRASGEQPIMDIARIRRELGLPPSA